MARDPKQLFVMNSCTRQDIAADLSSIAECAEYTHPSGQNTVLPDDDRLTDEICQAFADAIGYLDPSYSEEAIEEGEHNAAIAALESMGFVHVEEEYDESVDLLREISELEHELTLKRARLMQIDELNASEEISSSEPTKLD